jgi:hypothetical protein
MLMIRQSGRRNVKADGPSGCERSSVQTKRHEHRSLSEGTGRDEAGDNKPEPVHARH